MLKLLNKQSINILWQEDKGYYSQFIYGRTYKSLSPKSETLGEAFCVLFGIAENERSQKVIENTPMVPFGAACVYPQIPQIPPYHNNGIWPFVQAFWNISAAKQLNYSALEHGLASFYRPAAMFLTNKENFVAENGDFQGTEINSDRQLWSVAANMAMVYRVLLGMNFQKEGIALKPVVPEAYGDKIRVTNFKYRNATLDFEINGYGNKIKTIAIDGEEQKDAFVPGNLTGNHTVVIELNSSIKNKGEFKLVENKFAPATPIVKEDKESDKIAIGWDNILEVQKYAILKNGEEVDNIANEKDKTRFFFTIDALSALEEYQVKAIDENNSFLSEPIAKATSYSIEAEEFAPVSKLPYQGYEGKGFVELTKEKNTRVEMTFEAETEGKYVIDARYSNGSGPYNTDNKCAIRTLSINNRTIGVIVMPQIGKDEWSNFGYSNSWEVELKKGSNTIVLSFEDYNENMNGEVNTAMLDGIRLRKL
ncbi:MAG: hypothetical protein HC831_11620 [Chloroflexia bacterium]|nr:hypothetical protein [Chloroflexia bacterium]